MDVGPAHQPRSPLAFPSEGWATFPMLGTVPHSWGDFSTGWRESWKHRTISFSSFRRETSFPYSNSLTVLPQFLWLQCSLPNGMFTKQVLLELLSHCISIMGRCWLVFPGILALTRTLSYKMLHVPSLSPLILCTSLPSWRFWLLALLLILFWALLFNSSVSVTETVFLVHERQCNTV